MIKGKAELGNTERGLTPYFRAPGGQTLTEGRGGEERTRVNRGVSCVGKEGTMKPVYMALGALMTLVHPQYIKWKDCPSQRKEK